MKKVTQPKTDWRVLCTGILCLTGIELFALNQGVNGILLTTIIGIIALGIGVTIKNPMVK